MLKHRARSVLPVLIASLTAIIVSSPGPQAHASAAAAAGWRTVVSFGPAGQVSYLTDVVATGPSDAWAVGAERSAQPGQVMIVERWNGHAWHQVPVPNSLAARATGSAIAASSAANAWVLATSARNRQEVLRWHAGTWNTIRAPRWVFSDGSGVGGLSPAVFGPSNGWIFNLDANVYAKPSAPQAARYDGKGWRKVPLPGFPHAVSALAANNIWVVGPTTRTAFTPHPANVLMHWNGRFWHTFPLPRVGTPAGTIRQLDGIAPAGRSGAWAAYAYLSIKTVRLAGLVLLHWDGHSWRKFKVRMRGVRTPIAIGVDVPDGRGGAWGLHDAVAPGYPLQATDFSAAGRLTTSTIPRGSDTNLAALAWIPGTGSAWAVGKVAIDSTTAQALILRYRS